MRKAFGKHKIDPKIIFMPGTAVSVFAAEQKFYVETNFEQNNRGENVTTQQSCCQADG